MLKAPFLVIVLITFFSACQPPQEEDERIPANILTEDKFIDVLTDSYLAEGASGLNIKNVMGDKFDSTYAFNPLKDNGVRKSQFDSTIAYYSNHPQKMKVVYEKVLDKMSQIQAAGKLDK